MRCSLMPIKTATASSPTQSLRWQLPKPGRHSLAIFSCCSGDGESTATSRGAEASHIRYWDGSPGLNLQTQLVEWNQLSQLFSPPSPSSCPAQSDYASPLLPTPKPSLPSSCRGSITSLSTQVAISVTLPSILRWKCVNWIEIWDRTENKTSSTSFKNMLSTGFD